MVEREARPLPGGSAGAAWGAVLFVVIAVAGVFYAKWDPYFHKTFVAAAHHSIGASIVSGHAAAAPAPGWHAAWAYAVTYAKDIWQALVVGLLLGAGVQVLLPRDWLVRVLGRVGFRSAALAGLAAMAGMMCTCCSAPPAVGLAKSRASLGATLAWWLGSPTLNPATMIFMGFVLGWRWVALRFVAGAILVLGAALLAERIFPEAAAGAPAAATAAGPGASRPLLVRWLVAIGQLCIGLLPEYAVLLLAVGAARAWLFPAMNPALGHAAWLIVVLAVTGTLFVIPTAGEVPIIQTLTGFGLGAGGAGALLLTLAPVSLPSLVMVGRAVPVRVMVFVAAAVVVVGVASGFAALLLHL